MSVKPDKIYHINYTPKSEGFDLIERVSEGLFRAVKDGFDWCFIFENDDAMPVDYFERYLPYLQDYDFIGDNRTIYYNIKTLRWSAFNHPFRSSLFTTAFRISSLNNFEWPHSDGPFLDLRLWEYARYKRRMFVNSGAVGIKHGRGLCGGKGHLMRLKNPDPKMTFLKSKVSNYHIEFYKQYRKALFAHV